MIEVKPKVWLISWPVVDYNAVAEYLGDIGADGWETDAPTDAEFLVEFAGRNCYRSFGPGLNPNVTRVREGNQRYIGNIKQQAHGSVTEHAQFVFIFHNVSRVATHEIVRHRHAGISQESLRFVRLDKLRMPVPPEFENNPEAMAIFREAASYLEAVQGCLTQAFGITDDMPFAEKKKLTSAMRRLAPEGLGTSMVWSANVRTIRHVIEQRTAPWAEWEVRYIFAQVAQLVSEKFVNLFDDYTVEMVDELPWHKTSNPKI